MSDEMTATKPFERFGLTKERFDFLLQKYKEIEKKEENVFSNEELPFRDWEAELFREMFERQSENIKFQSLIVTMMKSIDFDYRRRCEENATRVVPKLRTDTIGLFIAPTTNLL